LGGVSFFGQSSEAGDAKTKLIFARPAHRERAARVSPNSASDLPGAEPNLSENVSIVRLGPAQRPEGRPVDRSVTSRILILLRRRDAGQRRTA
jgi:hypothetical protein